MLNLAVRSTEKEFMDDLDFSGQDLDESFSFIKFINLLGGGQRAVINGLKQTLKAWPKKKPMEILDVGCGLGDIGVAISRWGTANGFTIFYYGLEQNEHILQAARTQSGGKNIQFIQGNIFDEAIPEADLVIASMVFHHFNDQEIVKAIAHLSRKSRVALMINDLERSVSAYAICYLLTFFLQNEKSRKDALLSVEKGFTLEEMEGLMRTAGVQGSVRKAIGCRLLAIIPTCTS